MTIRLHTLDDLSPEAAREKAQEAGVQYGLVYAPGFFAILKREGQGWLRFPETASAPEDFDGWATIYEARLFGPQGELRWLREGAAGRAWYAGSSAPEGFDPGEVVAFETPDDVLLRGQGEGGPDRGWSMLSAARFGRMRVPCAWGEQRRTWLHRNALWTVRGGNDGNPTLQGTRLTGFSPCERGRLTEGPS